MAAPSPGLNSTSSDAANVVPALPSLRTDTPSKTLRGLNKPKCIQCGNVARSRCPYQSCKSCCSKAQNPCHIHVLKANASFPEKAQAASTPLFDQHSTEVSPAVTSLRVASLRQLSNNFSQFNNLHAARSRKPLTRKEAAAINEWRFSKLKEYRDGNIEEENEAFDRYVQNISLLEEVFYVSSKESTEDASTEEHPDKETAVQKPKIKLYCSKDENLRERVQEIVDGGLKKLQKSKLSDLQSDDELSEKHENTKRFRTERVSALNDLMDKLNKARNEEDLTSCWEMKIQLYNQEIETETKKDEEGTTKEDGLPKTPIKELDYLSQKLFKTTEIGPEDLEKIGAHFSSLPKVANL